eukprot:TRINITY_DN7461_c0_g1_i1.p1 TRINITY_DN7461_c0_g1~~TRINITY_DN7461_c0_g1_i1.p1  ORF type:complete len:560 (+),score=52.46 TRINITY_DN7461_c0_g1_i1:88-1767(+)
MNSSGSVCQARLRPETLCLKGTFIDVKSNEVLSPRPASDPGNWSTSASLNAFAAEVDYVEELSAHIAASCGASTLGMNTMDSLPTCTMDSLPTYTMDSLPDVREGLLSQDDTTQVNRVDLFSQVRSRLAANGIMLGCSECVDALSVIRRVLDEVRIVLHSNIAAVVQDIVAKANVMSDDICDSVSQLHGIVADSDARAVAAATIDALPNLLQNALEAEFAETYIAISGHLELLMVDLRSTHIGQTDPSDVVTKASLEVEQLLDAKVAAATHKCFEDAQRRIKEALHSFNQPRGISVHTRRRSRVPIARVMRVAQNSLSRTDEDITEHLEKTERHDTMASEDMEDTPLLLNRKRHGTGAFATHEGECQELTSPRVRESHAAGTSSRQEVVLSDREFTGAADSEFLLGSVGHPEVCARPCVFAATGRCERGFRCTFCHMDHETIPHHLDKRRRAALTRMTHEQRVATIMPIVRTKVINLLLDQDLLQDISDILNALQPLNNTPDEVKSMRNIQRTQSTKFTMRTLFKMMRENGPQVVPSHVQDSLDRLFSKIEADVVRRSV